MEEYKAERDMFVTEEGNINIGHIGNRTEIYIKDFSEIPEDILRFWREAKQEEDILKETIEKKFDDEPDTVLVPAGPFKMGSERGLGIPEWETTPGGQMAEMDLPAFRIGKYPVTNLQYWKFLDEEDIERKIPLKLRWRSGGIRPSVDQDYLPVSGITWYEALAYCAWLFKKTGRPYTLPSEAQWEKAARGDDGRLYPWGNNWDTKCCNTGYKKTPVTQYEDYHSFYECVDMVGNIREWTTTLWGEKRRVPLYRYPFKLKDENNRDLLDVNSQVRRCTRGGTALPLARHIPLRAARRGSEFPTERGMRDAHIGFRVALNAEKRRKPVNA